MPQEWQKLLLEMEPYRREVDRQLLKRIAEDIAFNRKLLKLLRKDREKRKCSKAS